MCQIRGLKVRLDSLLHDEHQSTRPTYLSACFFFSLSNITIMPCQECIRGIRLLHAYLRHLQIVSRSHSHSHTHTHSHSPSPSHSHSVLIGPQGKYNNTIAGYVSLPLSIPSCHYYHLQLTFPNPHAYLAN